MHRLFKMSFVTKITTVICTTTVVFYIKSSLLNLFHISFLIRDLFPLVQSSRFVPKDWILFFAAWSIFRSVLTKEFSQLSQPGNWISPGNFAFSQRLYLTKCSTSSTWQTQIAVALLCTQKKVMGQKVSSLSPSNLDVDLKTLSKQKLRQGKCRKCHSTATRHHLMIVEIDMEKCPEKFPFSSAAKFHIHPKISS